MTESVGSLLKKARLERNISLEQVAQATHIRLAYLEALENDRLDLLPSRVQARGFLRLYAGFLKIPIQPLLDVWEGKKESIVNASVTPLEENSAGTALLHSTEESSILKSDNQVAGLTLPQPDNLPAIPNSEQLFREVGLTLRQQRERLGLTLEEASSATHIRSRYLAALETAQMDQLPSLVHARGMLQNYAAFLGLDEDQVLLRFAEALQQRRLERTSKAQGLQQSSAQPIPPVSSPTLSWQRILSPDLIIAIGFIVALLGFTVWGALRISAAQSAKNQATPPSIAEVLAQAPTSPTQLSSPTAETNPESPVGILEAPGTLEATSTETPSIAPINAPLQLNVVAQLRVWMRVVADDKVVFEGRTTPGQVYAFGARQRIEFSTGNGAGVRLIFNQSDLDTPGAMGEAVYRIFTAEGFLTPTPQITVTPTMTPPPPSTPTPTPTRPTPTITPLIP
ncbi:RodZ domain-containing protein [uncultured Thermanaerothrix sp.]|uniref:helix-turn-helix domain-containing protein n=1 Tax=uncultured Thermanaerothrix sp. TaxID=1195149 RepID=UPI00260DAC73|nr:RodZ domain-containing protein [uncultured Thermanaerothrix sp.]